MHFNVEFLGLYGFSISTNLELWIQPEMVDYIMNLKSHQDFDGLMSAFDGLLGDRLSEMTANLKPAKTDFISWIRW